VRSSPVEDPDDVVRRHDRAEIAAMSSAVREVLPGLHPHPVRTDAYTDLYSSDGAPLVGRTAAGGRLLVASGFSGRGFKYAPALASVVADALVGRTEVPLDFMAPGRLVSLGNHRA
jgi:sarcosine oxidase